MTKRSSQADDEVEQSFYSIEDAARLARMSPSRLKRWIHGGIATPSQKIISPKHEVIESGFTLADVGYLHLLRHLVNDGVPLEAAVGIMYHFMQRFGPPGPKWRDAIVGRAPGRAGVVAYAPDPWLATLAVPGTEGAGQRYFDLLEDLLPVGVTLESLLIPAEFLPYVEINAKKEGGLPVVRGTRIRTNVVRAIADSAGEDAVTSDYFPHVPSSAVPHIVQFEKYLDEAA